MHDAIMSIASVLLLFW